MILLTKGTELTIFGQLKLLMMFSITELYSGEYPIFGLQRRMCFFSLLMYIIIAIYGRVKKSVMPLVIFWIIFLLDLEINFFWCSSCCRFVSFLLWERFHEVSLRWKSGWHYWGFQFNFKIPWWFIKYWQYLLWPNGGPDIPYRTPIKLSKFFRDEAPFLDLNLCISNGTVSTKVYDKRDDFDFDIVNFPFLDGDVPRRTSYGVNISQLIRFARASSNLNGFNYRNKALTAKFLRQGYRYFKLRKAFSEFYRRLFLVRKI